MRKPKPISNYAIGTILSFTILILLCIYSLFCMDKSGSRIVSARGGSTYPVTYDVITDKATGAEYLVVNSGTGKGGVSVIQLEEKNDTSE